MGIMFLKNTAVGNTDGILGITGTAAALRGGSTCRAALLSTELKSGYTKLTMATATTDIAIIRFKAPDCLKAANDESLRRALYTYER
jgi:hypothetical protein